MKKIVSTILASLTLVTCTVPAFASESDNIYSEPTALCEEWENVSDAHKITFERDNIPENDILLLSSDDPINYDDAQKVIAREHNGRVTEQAKQFVKSLNLAEQNCGYIEEFCLDELDYYATLEDVQIIEYTVYTPKQRLSDERSSPTKDDLMYFGTHQNRDFYFFYPSEAKATTNHKKQSTKSILQDWAKAILSALLSYSGGGGEVVSITSTWADFMSVSSLPKNYIVKDDAYSESYCDVVVHTRGIYTELGNGSYQMLTSQQFGEVFPYVNFFPLDRPAYPGCITKDYGFQGIVTSPRYNAGTKALCREAWDMFYGTLTFPDKLTLSSLKMYWK